MIKRPLIAVASIFVTWSILDFIIHGVLLQESYGATATLWRPEAEMKLGLMNLVKLNYAVFFVAIYTCLIRPKSLAKGLLYGVFLGIAAAVSMGFGSYTYMPIPMSMAVIWFLGATVEIILAGVIVGAVVKDCPSKSE